MKNRSILWYRQDLRLHDNEALYEALRWNDEVIPVYVFDPRVFNSVSIFGNRRMSVQRAQFIIDSAHNLRSSWKKIGSNLIVRIGHPEDVIFELAKEFKTDIVFCNRERTHDEVSVQDRLEQNLWTIGQEMRFTRGKMLYYTQDLPFPVPHTPNNYTQFKKELERIVPIRSLLPYPDSVSPILHEYKEGEIPELADLNINAPNSAKIYHGGEDEGIKKLKEYVWSPNGLAKYKSKEKSLVDKNYTSSLSPWLAQGCLSPKMVYHEIKSYESIHGSSESSQSIINELMRRDFCRLIAKKYVDKIFEENGVSAKATKSPQKDEDYFFTLWKEGRTGVPIIDAGMQALVKQGFIPNILRMACAVFLINNLKVHWRKGADWYESNLIDYDAATNWVTWMTLAGLLPEAQEDKFMSIDYLCKKYDPQGEFIKKWIPALEKIPVPKLFNPGSLDADEQIKFGLTLGKEYPKSVL